MMGILFCPTFFLLYSSNSKITGASAVPTDWISGDELMWGQQQHQQRQRQRQQQHRRTDNKYEYNLDYYTVVVERTRSLGKAAPVHA